MRSDPLRDIADGDATSQQAGHSFLFRADRKDTTTELLLIQKSSLLGAALVLAVAIMGAAAMIIQLRAGVLLAHDRGSCGGRCMRATAWLCGDVWYQ